MTAPQRSARVEGHELDAPPWRRVESTLMATSRALRRAYDEQLAETGLNQSEASVLALLDEDGPLSQSAVARRIGMRRAAAGTIIDRLEGLGLLRRQPGPDDARVWLLRPTDAAIPVIARVRAIDAGLRRRLRTGISRDDRRQLATTLDQIRRNLASLAGAPDGA